MMSTKQNWRKDIPQHTEDFLGDHKFDEVECIVSDLAGTSRGKAMPSQKFAPEDDMFLPVSLFFETISGAYVDMDIENQWFERDVILRPDLSTASPIPWASDKSIQLICDMLTRAGEPVAYAPRNVLRRVVDAYAREGWKPIVAPELEFYLTKPNTDPNEPIQPPVGRTGRQSVGSQVYSMAAVDDYGPVIDTIYDFAEIQGLGIDTVIQEGGAGQIEINLMHGNPVDLADQVFYFKRTIREAALKNNMFATFMARPMRDEPGSAMHVHQSVIDAKTSQNIFSDDQGEPTDLFYNFIGGLQMNLAEVLPLMAPYVNSYRRFTTEGHSAPTNLEWASDNRTTGLRVPISKPAARRVENRVIGMDCNPYLALAASLACGYLGMKNGINPRPSADTEIYECDAPLKRSLTAALADFSAAGEVRDLLGADFCNLYYDVKTAENEEYQREISPWERQYLLLNA